MRLKSAPVAPEKIQNLVRDKFVPSLTLTASLGTLVCCALLCLLVTVSQGVIFAHIANLFPELAQLNENRLEISALAFGMVSINSILTYIIRANHISPQNPRLVAMYLSERKFTKFVLIISWVILILGFVFSKLY